jgi:ABC-type dipeptide/oligopeptide/nickel transport system ATPase component
MKVIYGDLIYPLALRQGSVDYEIDSMNGKQITTRNIKDYWFKHISYIPQSSMSSLNPVVRIRTQFVDFLPPGNARTIPLKESGTMSRALTCRRRRSMPTHTSCRAGCDSALW